MSNDGTLTRWKKPKRSFYIDDLVEDLIRKGLLRKDFQGGDPFLTARCYLGRAIALAMNAERKKETADARRAKLKRLEKSARAIRKRLQKLAGEAEALLSIPSAMGSATLEPWVESKRRGAAGRLRPSLLSSSTRRSAVGDVLELEAALMAHRKNIPQSTDEAFQPAFIEEMVYCWVRLTAKVPRRGRANVEEFTAFVTAAHATLGTIGNSYHLALPFHVDAWNHDRERARSRSAEWGGQVDKTLKRISRRPEYDRGDRYERRFVPPTVGVQPSSVRRELGGTQTDFDRETKRLNRLMLDGSVEAAQILWCEWELAGQKLQNHFILSAEFGFNPSDARALIWPEGARLESAPL
jgi:hypothetical protein